VLVEPPWSQPFAHSRGTCVVAPGAAAGAQQKRWVFSALPSAAPGQQPPEKGWPVYISLVTDPFDGLGAAVGKPACGDTAGDPAAVLRAPALLLLAVALCLSGCSALLARRWRAHPRKQPLQLQQQQQQDDAPVPAISAQQPLLPPPPHSSGSGCCSRPLMFYCCSCCACMLCVVAAAAAVLGLFGSEILAYFGLASFKSYGAFELPAQAMATCFGGEDSHGAGCGYDQAAGALWDQRLQQYLVANGVAVLLVNPAEMDSWDSYAEAWESGDDQPFFTHLFAMIVAGELGHLDASRLVVRGWSGGAHMVSWLIQVFFSKKAPMISSSAADWPGVTLRGGVMLSGGSYSCYNDPSDEIVPVGSCRGCVASGAPEFCGNSDERCSSCNPAVKPFCAQCCPTNYTEQHFADHPEDWHKHPPVFLAQTSKTDTHADLCAAKNYYDTLVAHGVNRSKRESAASPIVFRLY
jgi:hypothetical protein